MNEPDNKPADDGAANADTVAEAVLSEKLADAQTPGFRTEFAPDEAELAGAFEEAALGEEEAAASGIDLLSLVEGDAKE
jgi:flagellar basal body rod protein FlgF